MLNKTLILLTLSRRLFYKLTNWHKSSDQCILVERSLNIHLKMGIVGLDQGVTNILYYRLEHDESLTKFATHSEKPPNHSNIKGLQCKISKSCHWGLFFKLHFCVFLSRKIHFWGSEKLP